MKTSKIFVLLLLLIAGSYVNAQIQLDSIQYDVDKSIPSLVIFSEQQKVTFTVKTKGLSKTVQAKEVLLQALR
jgi:hypothetical protein